MTDNTPDGTGPSSHLTWAEMACKDGTPYPSQWRVLRARELGRAFEMVRAAAGNRPIRVGSAYRTPAHNARVGGAKDSQHMQGRALDLYPPDGMELQTFYAIVRSVATRHGSPIRGLGRYPSFVHIDTRPITEGRFVVWQGSRAWAELKTGADS